ncbi:site-2 protease family protein [Candidatus Dependentiae bacterium]|nr:site-2 protease family protein [Candidatus Dependentiae bacterium]MCC7415071.1 site-2 protease family protein [Campylobacterota bacterium]
MPPFICALILVIQKLFFAACGIFGIGFVIGFHEFGHFIFCKLFNIEVPSFSIGFGPRLISKKVGETEFSISAIPLGGYVEIGGAAEEQGPLTERSFARKPWYQKMLVMIGGISFNIIFAYVALSILFMAGMPKSPIMYPVNATTTIALVTPDSPASQAGIVPGDILLQVNEQPVTHAQEFIQQIRANPKTAFSLTLQRADGTQQTVQATTNEQELHGKPAGTLGIMFDMSPIAPLSFFTALQQGAAMTNSMIKNTFYAYKNIIGKKDISQVGGPIMIISETMTGASKGAKILLLFLAFISVTLAILNLIPLPILDGGQMLFYTLEALIRRPIPFNIRWYIHIGTWIAFMILTAYLSIKDILRIVSPYVESIKATLGL